jgi:hypothetical protein
VEPDDFAYRASIVGITDGHLLTLSTAQVNALTGQLGREPGSALTLGPGQAPPQWSSSGGKSGSHRAAPAE